MGDFSQNKVRDKSGQLLALLGTVQIVSTYTKNIQFIKNQLTVIL